MDKRFARVAIRTPGPIFAAALVSLLALSGCHGPEADKIANACIKAGNLTGLAEHGVLARKCACTSNAAKQYLDPENYALLTSVASIYVSADLDVNKARRLAKALASAGRTPLQASMAAADLIYFSHKADRMCQIT